MLVKRDTLSLVVFISLAIFTIEVEVEVIRSMDRNAGHFLAPAEGFGLQPRLFLLFGQK